MSPPVNSCELVDDSGVQVERLGYGGQGGGLRQGELQQPQAVFPMQEAGEVEKLEEDELICQPCDEEEQAENPKSLPSVYQPTHSEYLDHRITHYPFRAWCKHCIEGRG